MIFCFIVFIIINIMSYGIEFLSLEMEEKYKRLGRITSSGGQPQSGVHPV